jgi:polyphenol oxidase
MVGTFGPGPRERLRLFRILMVSYHFFNRHGGVSDGRYASLNLSYGTGDADLNIERNRDIVRKRVGTTRLLSAHQVHGRRIYVDDGAAGSDEVGGYDALLSDCPGTALLIQQADCQAVLLYDPVNQAIGAVHSGWRGSVVNIIGAAIEQMKHSFGTIAADLQARIGPSLGPCCAEFTNHRAELPENFKDFRTGENYFDFWQISAHQLTTAGVSRAAIALPDICTSCSDDYFSYRRAVREGDPVCGRHGSVICLESV